jgi:alkylation response protein AidB-like acyl-CoA dehydrogenase
MADIHIGIETLRSTLWQLVYRLDAGLGAVPQALALRAQACDLAHLAGHKCQHLHGGMGVDVTYPIHRFLYWSRALSAEIGGRDAHLQRLGDWLADHDRLGWKYDLPEDTLS